MAGMVIWMYLRAWRATFISLVIFSGVPLISSDFLSIFRLGYLSSEQ